MFIKICILLTDHDKHDLRYLLSKFFHGFDQTPHTLLRVIPANKQHNKPIIKPVFSADIISILMLEDSSIHAVWYDRDIVITDTKGLV